MIDLEKFKLLIKNIKSEYVKNRSDASFVISDFTSKTQELISALEEAKEIMFDIEQGKDPSFYIKEWLAKYFQASVG